MGCEGLVVWVVVRGSVRGHGRRRMVIMLSLPVLGGALGSPGWAGAPDLVVRQGRQGQVGGVGPELWLQVVAVVVLVMWVEVMLVVVVVRTAVHLDRSPGEPWRGVVGWSGVDGVAAVEGPGPGRAGPVLLVRGEALVLVAKHLGSPGSTDSG